MFGEIFFLLLVLVLTRTLWRRWKYDLHKIPSPPSLPFLGHILEFAGGGKHFVKWFRKRHAELGYPKIVQFRLLADDWVFVMDPVSVRTEINHKIDPIPRHPIMKAFSQPIVCSQVDQEILMATSNKAHAKQIRKAYSIGLTTFQLKKSLPEMKSLMHQLLQIIEKKRKEGPIDFQPLCVDFSLDAIGIVALGTRLGGLDGTRGIRKGIIGTGVIGRENILKPFLKAYCSFFPNSGVAKEREKTIADLKKEWDALTTEILERPDPPKGETPIWYNLKTVIDPMTNARLPYESLRSEFATLVLGGMDTTGHEISWILGMLASHSDIAEKVVNELKENGLCGPNARDVEFEDLASFPYLNAVIKEGFRMIHILPYSVPRLLQKDATIFGHRLPKGTLIVFPSNQAVNSKADWGDPEVVRPERWLSGEDMSSKFYETFQTGPRDCPGQKLAMMEMRLVLAKLLSNYHFSTEKSFEELLEYAEDGAVTECSLGMWLNVVPRKDLQEVL